MSTTESAKDSVKDSAKDTSGKDEKMYVPSRNYVDVYFLGNLLCYDLTRYILTLSLYGDISHDDSIRRSI